MNPTRHIPATPTPIQYQYTPQHKSITTTAAINYDFDAIKLLLDSLKSIEKQNIKLELDNYKIKNNLINPYPWLDIELENKLNSKAHTSFTILHYLTNILKSTKEKKQPTIRTTHKRSIQIEAIRNNNVLTDVTNEGILINDTFQDTSNRDDLLMSEFNISKISNVSSTYYDHYFPKTQNTNDNYARNFSNSRPKPPSHYSSSSLSSNTPSPRNKSIETFEISKENMVHLYNESTSGIPELTKSPEFYKLTKLKQELLDQQSNYDRHYLEKNDEIKLLDGKCKAFDITIKNLYKEAVLVKSEHLSNRESLESKLLTQDKTLKQAKDKYERLESINSATLSDMHQLKESERNLVKRIEVLEYEQKMHVKVSEQIIKFEMRDKQTGTEEVQDLENDTIKVEEHNQIMMYEEKLDILRCHIHQLDEETVIYLFLFF